MSGFGFLRGVVSTVASTATAYLEEGAKVLENLDDQFGNQEGEGEGHGPDEHERVKRRESDEPSTNQYEGGLTSPARLAVESPREKKSPLKEEGPTQIKLSIESPGEAFAAWGKSRAHMDMNVLVMTIVADMRGWARW
jgi:hypothetical protein